MGDLPLQVPQGPWGPGSWSGCCSGSQPDSSSFCSAALVLGFDWGKFLKDHSYKAAPVSCFKHVSALELREGGQGAGHGAAPLPASLGGFRLDGGSGEVFALNSLIVSAFSFPGELPHTCV